MKVLVIRFSSIGDIVLTTPIVRCLAKQPQMAVHFLCAPGFKTVLQSNPYIDRIWTWDKEMNEIIPKLKTESYDYVIDLQNNIRSLRIKRALGIKSFSFNKLNIQKWIYVNFKIDLLPPIHIVSRYFEAVKELDISNDGKGLDFFISQADVDMASELIKGFNNEPYTAVVLGAAHRTKQIPFEKISQLLERIEGKVVLIGGRGEAEIGQRLANAKCINTAGKCNIGTSAALLKGCRVVLTPDTGMMHIAAALKKPIVSVWGNTVPQFGMYPYYGNHKVREFRAEVDALSCRPCSKIGYSKCPKGHFKCMNEQNVQEWVRKIAELHEQYG